jgi:hypothetical protein
MSTNKVFNIKSAAAYLGIEMQSFRTALKKGKISGTIRQHPTMPGVRRWEFTQEALDAYKASRKSFGSAPREDGRKHRHVLIPQDKLVAFDKWVKDNGGITYKPTKATKVTK